VPYTKRSVNGRPALRSLARLVAKPPRPTMNWTCCLRLGHAHGIRPRKVLIAARAGLGFSACAKTMRRRYEIASVSLDVGVMSEMKSLLRHALRCDRVSAACLHCRCKRTRGVCPPAFRWSVAGVVRFVRAATRHVIASAHCDGKSSFWAVYPNTFFTNWDFQAFGRASEPCSRCRDRRSTTMRAPWFDF